MYKRKLINYYHRDRWSKKYIISFIHTPRHRWNGRTSDRCRESKLRKKRRTLNFLLHWWAHSNNATFSWSNTLSIQRVFRSSSLL